MGTLGRSTRNGKKVAPRRIQRDERPDRAAAKLAVVLREHNEAIEQQAATAEILRALSRSSTNPQPVFEAMVEHAHRLCGAVFSILYRYDGSVMTVVADRVNAKASRILRSLYPAPPRRDHIVGRAILEGRVMHSADIRNDPRFPGNRNAFMKAVPFRAALEVPLLRNGAVIGAIAVGRLEPKAFTKREISLLQTFADQAVIAIENARLFNETKEALERQTATAEILKVISGSPTDTQPVFDAILERAIKLCDAETGILFRYMDGAFHALAKRIHDPAFAELFKKPRRPAPGAKTGLGRLMRERRAVHIPDITKDEAYVERDPLRLETVAGGMRAWLGAPMLKDGDLVGAIVVYRTEPRPFSEQQVSLLQIFADQAVIAIENVRLFNETKEALEQQTATAEILKVISSSPTATQPVFEAIVQSAARLFAPCNAAIVMREGDVLQRKARAGPESREVDAAAVASIYPLPFDPERSMVARSVIERRIIEIPDTEAEGLPGILKSVAKAAGYRAITLVPLIREGEGIGVIGLNRPEPGFKLTEKQLALVRTFADQAVIAIENARLFNETKQALERQTATSEILSVISSSPTDIQPVFDAVVENAARLCDAPNANVFRVEGDVMRKASQYGSVETTLAVGETRAITAGSISGRAILERQIIHVADALALVDTDYAEIRETVRREGLRTVIGIPLLREGVPIGAITVYRTEVRPFSDEQIALLQTFANQAVIAIENVRLFNETKEALERQTATAEILRVISQSPTDTQPVFDAIVQSAVRLCAGSFGSMQRLDGETIHLWASYNPSPEGRELLAKRFPAPLSEHSLVALALRTGTLVHSADTSSDPRASQHAVPRALGVRSQLTVPLIKDGKIMGALNVARAMAGAFSDTQIAMLKTFAEQAVIAIENVRLFNETKESLEQQTATAEILRVISSTPTDIQPVFDAIAKSAMRIFEGMEVAVALVDGSDFVIKATSVDHARVGVGLRVPLDRNSAGGRSILDATVVNIADTESAEAPPVTRQRARDIGFRAFAAAPMMREGTAIGHIAVMRQRPVALSEKQIALLRTFADQAVIAIENVRLFNETKEALEQQTATSEILGVISASPTDLAPVFDAILKRGLQLCEAHVGHLHLFDGEFYRTVAQRGATPEFAKYIAERGAYKPEGAVLRPVPNAEPLHIPDLKETPEYLARKPNTVKFVELGGARTCLSVPLLKEGKALGVLVIYRPEVRPFTEKQIALISLFASQAVIAIENVRLFKQLQERTEALTNSVSQLTALGKVGQAISSTLDLETVLKTIVAHAVELTGLDSGAIYEYDEVSELFTLQAAEKFEPELAQAVRRRPIRKGDGATGRIAVTLEAEQVADIEDESYGGTRKDVLVRAGYRAVLAVPLLRESHLLGALQVFRRAPGPFAPEVVELLKTFATQSAMAIQNARLYREIAEKGEQLEVASRHKSDFLASMSHELRTPLNALLGFNEMLLGDIYGEVPADMKPPLAQMQSSGKHLLRLINNVLDLAKIEAGRMELALADYSVHDTVESVRSTLHPLAADKRLEFRAAVQPDIPLAYGDPGRITQCLMNLAGNSLKFTKAGKVEISVALNNGHLRYSVADTGIGIAPDKMQSLFTEFKQTDATIASEYGGTGLGLSISKKFVEMHGGRIWAESAPGRGSTFIFEIPLRAQASRAA
jgi:GAF domain-containing protein